MGKKIVKILAAALSCVLLAALLCVGLMDYFVPAEVTVCAEEDLPSYPCVALSEREKVEDTEMFRVSTVSAKLFGIINLKKIQVREYRDIALIPGGMNFGVRMLTDGVMVVGLSEVTSGGKACNPAADAGLKEKDIIITIDGKKVTSVAQVTALFESTGGRAVCVRCRRGEVEMEFRVTPVRADADGKYKTGIWVRDTSSGIGTVTFIVPGTGAFGALGHGICDPDTGALAPLSRGTVTDVVISNIVKGSAGTPGELRGYLKGEKKGTVISNTDCGVYGVLSDCREGNAIPVAPASEVKTGKASIYCTLEDGRRQQYEIEITAINQKGKTKSFTVKVTDPALLARTGGIVQGMSGSPILQNGKLIGAVTHVFINDPTGGYGIFIENMLDEMPEALSPGATD